MGVWESVYPRSEGNPYRSVLMLNSLVIIIKTCDSMMAIPPQEIWKMLDDESRPMTPAENSGKALINQWCIMQVTMPYQSLAQWDFSVSVLSQGPFAGLQFPGDTEQASKEKDVREMVVEGQRPIMEAKMKPSSAKLSPRSAGRVICSAIQKKQQQIRNYNLRDSNEEPKRWSQWRLTWKWIITLWYPSQSFI